MLKQYFAIKEQHQDAVLLFHLGDFYEMFGPDAVECARILDLTLTARNKGTDNEIAMCGVPLKAASGYIAKLTKAGKKVALCEQITAPDGTGIVQRAVTQIVTPGTTFDDSILEQKQNNFLACVDAQNCAVAVVDATTGNFQTALFENQEQMLDDLLRLAPSEILLLKADEAFAKLLPSAVYVQIFAMPAWLEPTKILEEHFGIKGLQAFGLAEDPALQSVCATALHYLKETQKTRLGHVQSIERRQVGEQMLLDQATISNLELESLFSVIDYTQTAMGGRLLRSWLLHPLLQAAQIKARLTAVQALLPNPAELKGMCDLERLLGKIGVERVNPRDVYNVKETLLRVPAIKKDLPTSKLLEQIQAQIQEHPEVIAEIQRVIIAEPPVLMQEGGYIAAGVHKELDELRQISTSGKTWISDLQIKERQRTGINSLKVKYNRVFGYYIEISNSNLSNVPADYIRKQTLTNGERYITPELKEYEEKVLGAQEKILVLEEQIFSQLKTFLLAHLPALQKTAQALAQIDALSGLARLANARNYTQPELVAENILEIKQGRHPVIEAIQNAPYIANDVTFGDDQHFLLITGPNMSGKSSYLRQTALIVLLAQIGSFVPAQSLRFKPVDRIFTRVGASDNLAAGRSTFMVEMQEASYILRQATANSLIILDELGRGTSTYDGLSLAWAITEFLHDGVRAKTLFATHYHELIEVVDKLERGRNYSVAVAENEQGVVFLHQVLSGGINRSYGIEVGKLAGLPHNIILRAKDLLTRLEQHTWENNAPEKQQSLPLMPIKQEQHPVVTELRDLDCNNLTPLQALQKLTDWKNKL